MEPAKHVPGKERLIVLPAATWPRAQDPMRWQELLETPLAQDRSRGRLVSRLNA